MNAPRLITFAHRDSTYNRESTDTAERERRYRETYERKNAEARKRRKHEWYMAHREDCIRKAVERKRNNRGMK